MTREKLLRIVQIEFNLNTMQTRFLQQFIFNVNDLINENFIIVLSMFRKIVKNMFKKISSLLKTIKLLKILKLIRSRYKIQSSEKFICGLFSRQKYK